MLVIALALLILFLFQISSRVLSSPKAKKILRIDAPSRRAGKMYDTLMGHSFGTDKRYYSKRNFDEIDAAGFNDFSKRNFDEIDNAGFKDYLKKRNFDEIDAAGFNDFSKRSDDAKEGTYEESSVGKAKGGDVKCKKNFDEIDAAGFNDFSKRNSETQRKHHSIKAFLHALKHKIHDDLAPYYDDYYHHYDDDDHHYDYAPYYSKYRSEKYHKVPLTHSPYHSPYYNGIIGILPPHYRPYYNGILPPHYRPYYNGILPQLLPPYHHGKHGDVSPSHPPFYGPKNDNPYFTTNSIVIPFKGNTPDYDFLSRVIKFLKQKYGKYLSGTDHPAAYRYDDPSNNDVADSQYYRASDSEVVDDHHTTDPKPQH